MTRRRLRTAIWTVVMIAALWAPTIAVAPVRTWA